MTEKSYDVATENIEIHVGTKTSTMGENNRYEVRQLDAGWMIDHFYMPQNSTFEHKQMFIPSSIVKNIFAPLIAKDELKD